MCCCLTDLGGAAETDHVDGNTVVVHARRFGVDAREAAPLAAASIIVVVAVVSRDARTFTALHRYAGNARTSKRRHAGERRDGGCGLVC